MKPNDTLRQSWVLAALPRFANRGLIEASGVIFPHSIAWYFPDSRIGASLKLRPFAVCRLGGCDYFPDSRIGASLKRIGPIDFSYRALGTSPIRESGPH